MDYVHDTEMPRWVPQGMRADSGREVTATETISGASGHEGPAHAWRDCQCRKNDGVYRSSAETSWVKGCRRAKLITADGLAEGF